MYKTKRNAVKKINIEELVFSFQLDFFLLNLILIIFKQIGKSQKEKEMHHVGTIKQLIRRKKNYTN